MGFKLHANFLQNLPPLSWLCEFQNGSSTYALYHGKSVEVSSHAFFEGAWAGQYLDWNFDTESNVFGSGGAINAAGATFVPPSHTLEPIYVSRDDSTATISNSLPFLLSRRQDELDPANWQYGRIFCSIVKGLHASPVRLPTLFGHIDIVYFYNAVFDSTGSYALHPKADAPRFGRFSDYAQYLRDVVSQTIENARAAERQSRYEPVTTLSSGYDSVACAVIAANLGCRQAISLRSARGGADDSGTCVASVLDLKLEQFERVEHSTDDTVGQDEFLATGMQAEDFVFKAFEKRLPGSLLLTGFHGDKVWDKAGAPTTNIKRGDVSGSSLGEFRLRNDFVHLPVPFIGALNHPDIHEISNSVEMRSYSVGGTYDRPIPRRLAEEAGVPRQEFGQQKKAVTILFFWKASLLSRRQLKSIAAFRNQTNIATMARIRYCLLAIWWNLGRLLASLPWPTGSNATNSSDTSSAPNTSTGSLKRRLFAFAFREDFEIFEHSHPRNTHWTRWALDRIKRRYTT